MRKVQRTQVFFRHTHFENLVVGCRPGLDRLFGARDRVPYGNDLPLRIVPDERINVCHWLTPDQIDDDNELFVPRYFA